MESQYPLDYHRDIYHADRVWYLEYSISPRIDCDYRDDARMAYVGQYFFSDCLTPSASRESRISRDGGICIFHDRDWWWR